jgi:hypothetical protein
MKLNDLSLTPSELQALQQALPKMTVQEKMELMDMLEERERRASLYNARDHMLELCETTSIRALRSGHSTGSWRRSSKT